MNQRFFSSINKASIIVTNNAWSKINEIGKKQNALRFLFSATGGGCNGYNYKLGLIKDKEYDDIYHSNKIKPTIIKKNNNEVLVDPMSEFLLLGTTIDYIYEDYSNGVFENKFVFIPDKTYASSCGCGVSFTPKLTN